MAKENVNKVKITLPRLRGTDVDQRVYVAVNGESYMIVRGKEVEVPDYIAACLKESQAQLDSADMMIAGKTEKAE